MPHGAVVAACRGKAGGSGPSFVPSSVAGLQLWLKSDAGLWQRSATGSIVTIAVTSNVATVATGAAHGMSVGSTARIAGNAAVPDGDYVVASTPLTTSFTFAIVEADVGATAGGTWTDATAALVDAAPVGTWLDQSGQGNHAAQATASKRPALKLAIINGRPVIRFDAVDDLLSCGDVGALDVGTGGFSLFMVLRRLAATTGGIVLKDNWAGSGNGLFLNGSGSNYIYYNGSANSTIGTGTTTPHLLSVIRSGTGSNQTQRYYDNGAAANSTDGRTLSNATALVLSNSADQGRPGGIDLAELLIYSAALGAPDAGSLKSYLNSRWGLW